MQPDETIRERDRALALLDVGNAGDAAALLSALLAGGKEDADLLGLLALANEQLGERDAAIEALEKAIEMPAEVSVSLRNACNLISMLIESGRRSEAIGLLRRGWHLPARQELRPSHLDCITHLARAMIAFALYDEAITLLSPLAERRRLDWPAVKALTTALAHVGKHDEALQVTSSGKPDEGAAHERDALLAYLNWKTRRRREASDARRAYLTGSPPCLLPARPTQKYVVGVLESNPTFETLIHPPEFHHFTANYPWMMAKRQADTYRFVSIFIGASPRVIDKFNQTRPRVLINNVANGEVLRSAENLENTKRVLSLFDAPVINHPDQAVQCTRQMNAARLASVSGLRAPKVLRFPNDSTRFEHILDEIEENLIYPVIIRTTDEQEANNMTLQHTRSGVESALINLHRDQFYCIEYIGEHRRENYFRRIRAAFIGGAPLIIRADYCDDWIVRSRNKIPLELYRSRPGLVAEADAIIERPVEELGNAAMKTLEEIGRVIPLDIFGMDFDVDDGGHVLFFEANASMNLFSNAPDEFPYPARAEKALKEALEGMLDSRAR